MITFLGRRVDWGFAGNNRLQWARFQPVRIWFMVLGVSTLVDGSWDTRCDFTKLICSANSRLQSPTHGRTRTFTLNSKLVNVIFHHDAVFSQSLYKSPHLSKYPSSVAASYKSDKPFQWTPVMRMNITYGISRNGSEPKMQSVLWLLDLVILLSKVKGNPRTWRRYLSAFSWQCGSVLVLLTVSSKCILIPHP